MSRSSGRNERDVVDETLYDYFSSEVEKVKVPDPPFISGDDAGRTLKRPASDSILLRAAAVFVFLAFLSPLVFRETWNPPLAGKVSAYCAENRIQEKVNESLYKAHLFFKKYYTHGGNK